MILIDHYGLAVPELSGSESFYKSLGFKSINQFKKDMPEMKAVILEKNGSKVELFEFKDRDDPIAKILSKHIGLLSDDFENDLMRFLENGFEIAIPETRGVTVKRFIFLMDSKGNHFELFGR